MTIQESVEQDGLFERRVDKTTGQNSLHAMAHIPKGSVICKFGARTVSTKPTMYTLQVSETEHIDLSPEILSFANHSCQPNFFFNTADRCMEALEDIQPGDALTFFYPSTELEMDCPFQCYCGAACCLGTIQGAANLPKDVLDRYKINNHITRLLAKRAACCA